ncbi:hypothetical protein ACFCYI_09015 [Streptomyces sp. NPDC056257]
MASAPNCGSPRAARPATAGAGAEEAGVAGADAPDLPAPGRLTT